MQRFCKKNLYLIHGWGFGNRVMENLVPHLDKKYHTSLLEMPGYGTGRSGSDRNSKDIDAVADALIPNITTKSILCGWSLGGMVATRIAGKMKNRIDALALVASTPCFVRKADWPHGIEKNLLENMQQRITGGEKEKVLKEFSLLVAKGDALSKDILRKLYSLIADGTPAENTLQDGLNILKQTDLRADFEKLDCPVILILADSDHLIATTTGEAAKKICKNAQTIYLESAGHAPFISRPMEFCDLLSTSLKDIS